MQSARETWFILLSVPFYAILIGTEILLSNWQQKKFYSLKETLQNVYLTLVNAGLDMLLRWLFYISILTWSYQHYFFKIENAWLYWFALFILEDLISNPPLRLVMAGFLIVLILANFSPMSFGRTDWQNPYLKVDTSSIPASSEKIVVLLGGSPTAYVLPFFPATMRFVRPSGNLYLNDATQNIRNIKVLLSQLKNKEFYILYNADEKLNPSEEISKLEVIVYLKNCIKLISSFPDHLNLCQAVQP